MCARRRSVAIAAQALLALGLAGTSIADEDAAYKIIVNAENPVDSIDRNFLRDGYLKKTSAWGSGDALHPIDLNAKLPARDAFVRQVIRKTPAQLRSYWNQQIFSGKGTPPPALDSIAGVVAYVVADKGAVAYIPASADPGKAKVVTVK